MQYSIDADAEFLRVQVSGRDADQPPSDLCALELDQKFPLSPTSQHQLVTRLPQIGFSYRHRIALVHKTVEARKSNDFINVVAFNRGVNVRNFPNLEDAHAWLREPGAG